MSNIRIFFYTLIYSGFIVTYILFWYNYMKQYKDMRYTEGFSNEGVWPDYQILILKECGTNGSLYIQH